MRMFMPFGRGPLEYIAEPEQKEVLEPILDVCREHYRKVEHWERPIKLHLKAESEEPKWPGKERNEEVKIDLELEEHFVEQIETIPKFESRWDGHLGVISVARHCNDLKSKEMQLLHCTLYWAGQNSGKFERAEINRMQKMGVIELAKSEWAGPMVHTTNGK